MNVVTAREWVEKNKPEALNHESLTGVKGCPHNYFSAPSLISYCFQGEVPRGTDCFYCWEQLIVEEEARSL